MKIEIIGPGCPFCKRLCERVKEVVRENNIDADVQHLTNFKSWIQHFPMTPVLIVDGEIKHRGKWLPNKEKILNLLTGA